MNDHITVIDNYLTAFAEPDENVRRELVGRCFAPDATLADPPFEATGHDQLVATFGGVVEHYPDHRFVRTSGVDEHHGTARYSWSLVAPDGSAPFTGIDIVRFDETGMIAAVTGFFGELPAAA